MSAEGTKRAKKVEGQTSIDVPASMEVFQVHVDSLKAHPLNANKHKNLAKIVESLQAHGQYVPIVVWGEDKTTILKGHGTVEAAKVAEIQTINVVYSFVDEVEAAQIVAIDNASSDGAEYDKELLAKLIAAGARPSRTRKIVAGIEQTDFFGTGFDIDTLETLQAEAGNISEARLEETAAKFADHATYDPEAQAEAMKKLKTVSGVAKAQGFHEVILMYAVEDYDKFMARVKALQKFWGIESVGKTILAMMERTLPPTPEETEASFLELQDAIKADKGNELLAAFQAGVYTRTALAGKVEA